MTIEATLDRLATNIALLTGAVATLAESVNGRYHGKPIYADTVVEPPKAPAAPAPVEKKARTPKPAATTVEPATPAAQAPVTEAAVATVTSPSESAGKEPTLDDVRAALVALQTRKGSKAEPQKILEKFSPTKVTGGLPKEAYAKLIAECAAA